MHIEKHGPSIGTSSAKWTTVLVQDPKCTKWSNLGTSLILTLCTSHFTKIRSLLPNQVLVLSSWVHRSLLMLEQNFQRFKDAKENWLDSLWKQPVVVCPNHTSRNDDEKKRHEITGSSAQVWVHPTLHHKFDVGWRAWRVGGRVDPCHSYVDPIVVENPRRSSMSSVCNWCAFEDWGFSGLSEGWRVVY